MKLFFLILQTKFAYREHSIAVTCAQSIGSFRRLTVVFSQERGCQYA